MMGSLKRGIEWLLCRSWFGVFISRMQGDWITSPSIPRGWAPVRVLAPRATVSYATRASLFWGFHEAQEIRYVTAHLPLDLPVIELGTSLGAVSAHIARRLNGGRRMVCVEANSRILSLARETIFMNAPSTDVVLIPAAVDYRNETVPFAVSEDLISSRVAQGDELLSRVPAITLMSILEQVDVREYSLVCDIEGAELQILENDLEALARCRVMIIELHDTPTLSIDQMAQVIAAAGFHRKAQHGAVFVFSRA
jgi:FkbM family methyltransferase